VDDVVVPKTPVASAAVAPVATATAAAAASVTSSTEFGSVRATLLNRLAAANEKLAKTGIDETREAEKWIDHICKLVAAVKLTGQ